MTIPSAEPEQWNRFYALSSIALGPLLLLHQVKDVVDAHALIGNDFVGFTALDVRFDTVNIGRVRGIRRLESLAPTGVLAVGTRVGVWNVDSLDFLSGHGVARMLDDPRTHFWDIAGCFRRDCFSVGELYW